MEYDSYELYHYGIKGMKWGIRRTPAQLGHVTKKVGSTAKKVGSAISKRASEAKKNRDAKKTHDEEVKRAQKNSKKKLSELTNDELRERIQRMELEQRYRQLTPQQKTKGQAFISTVGNQVIKPAATNAARQYLEKQLKNALGLNEKSDDPLKKLREEADRATLQNRKEVAEEAIRNRAAKAAESKSGGNASNSSSGGSSGSSRRDSYDDVTDVTNFTVGDTSPTVTNVGRVYSQNVLGGVSIAGLLGPGEDRYRN